MIEEQAIHDESGPEPEQVGAASSRCAPAWSGSTPCVDAVAGLADRPVDEHVAVFESAHDELRRTLDAPPDDAE